VLASALVACLVLVSGATAASLPGAPQSLAASRAANGADGVTLTWQPPADSGGAPIDAYVLDLSLDAGASWTNGYATYLGTATSATGVHCPETIACRYRLHARNSAGVGAASAVATLPQPLPGAPQSLTAARTANGQNGVSLTWQAPASTGGLPLEHYSLDVSTNGGSTWSNGAATFAASALSASGVACPEAIACMYRLHAYTGNGLGPSSAIATVALTLPGAPTALVAARTANGPNGVTLTWLAPLLTGGLPIESYVLDRSTDGGSTWSNGVASFAGNAISASGVGCPETVPCQFRLHASTGNGAGPAGGIAAITQTLPGAPIGLVAAKVANGSNGVVLSWQPPLTTGGLPLEAYRLELSLDGGISWSSNAAFAGNATSATGVYCPEAVPCRYRLHAYTGNGQGPASTPAALAIPLPSAPMALTATRTANGPNGVSLAWLAPTNTGALPIEEYRLDVSLDGGFSWTGNVAVFAGDATSATGVACPEGIPCRYRLHAYTGNGLGPASAIAPVAQPLPTAPPSLVATRTANGPNGITLTWQAPASTGGLPIEAYKGDVSTDGGNSWTSNALTFAGDATSATNVACPEAIACRYRLHAYTGNGLGPPSATATFTLTPPSAPTALTAARTANGPNGVSLSWQAPASGGGLPIESYRLEYSLDAGFTWSQNTTLAGDATSATGIACPEGTPCRFRLSAWTGNGRGPVSTIAAIVQTLPDVPTALTAARTANGPNGVTLTWQPPASSGGLPIELYRVDRSTDGGNSWANTFTTIPGSRTSASGIACPEGIACRYRLHTYTGNGASGPSNVASFALVLPGVPTALTAVRTSNGPNGVTLTWQAAPTNGALPIEFYEADLSTDSGNSWTPNAATFPGNVTSVSNAPCPEGIACRYRLHAFTGNGLGGASTVALIAQTSPDAPPTLTAMRTANGPNGITLTWQAPADTGGLPIERYDVDFSTDGGTTWTNGWTSLPPSPTSAAGVQCPEVTPCRYRLHAYTGNGASLPSPVAVVTLTPPGAPYALTAARTVNGPNGVTLTWHAPASDGGLPIELYYVDVSTDGGGSWSANAVSFAGTATSATGVACPEAVPCLYRLHAFTGNGEGAASNIGAFPQPLPDAPTGLTATRTANGPSGVSLTWQAPAGNGGLPIELYYLDVSTDGGNTWSTSAASFAGTATSASGVACPEVIACRYRLHAYTGNGLGPASFRAIVPLTLPSEPLSAAAVRTANGPNGVTLTWQPPTSTGGLPVELYEADYSVDGGSTWTTNWTSFPGSVTSASGVACPETIACRYRLHAVTGNGEGPGSGGAVVPLTLPSAPQSPVATWDAVTSTVSLTWQPPASGGGLPIETYYLDVSTDGGNTWTADAASFAGGATSATGLACPLRAACRYRLHAYTGNGEGPASAIVQP
jgi:hypothetical protein